MSSSAVRTEILNFITTEFPLEKLVDLTAEFRDLQDIMTAHAIARGETWLGIQFIGSEEIPITVQSHNTKGKYRETGVILLHIVDVAKIGVGPALLARSETFRNKFRGQRLGRVLIESVSPPNFENGATLQFEGGYTSCSVTLVYEADLDL